MRECNNCDSRTCDIGDRLGPLPKIPWGSRAAHDHCRKTPKKDINLSGGCPVHIPLRDFKPPMIHHLIANNPQGLYNALLAVGLQIDPAHGRRGYAVVETW